jgi:cyclophilin family peptidyl-prolyl cis-trans isomerase
MILKMKNSILLVLLTITTFFSCQKNNLPEGLYAEIETTKGTITLSLNYEKAPITVANFITLAEGTNEFVTDESLKNKPFYNGLKFHRVLDNFMIQTGDPLGTGMGGAGYQFKDEFTDLKFDKEGVLAMANGGPATNSSQFFITHLETPWLDGKHTIFGQIVGNSMAVVNTIKQDDTIKKVTIIRNGDQAKKFDAVKIFHDYFTVEAENQKKQMAIAAEEQKNFEANAQGVYNKKAKDLAALKLKSIKTKTGLQYVITQKGTGKKPVAGAQVYIHYAGFLEKGILFDSSVESVAKTFGIWNPNRAAQKGYQPIPFEFGKKEGMIPGFIEGIELLSFGDKAVVFIPSSLGYGANGAGDAIPPNANIIFEMELIENKPE